MMERGMIMEKVTLIFDPEREISRIAPEIYGQFSEHLGRCIYEGIFVGEDSDIPNIKGIRTDVVEALREIKVPVLRWPGGCFADEYHWKDGIGPKENRKKMVNTNWGGVVEDNSFGTHEFMELCEQVGCEPYIAVNVGSGTVQEAAEWVEYLTFDGISPMAQLREQNGRKEPWKVKYLGVGNENWGCGGSMSPEYYADEYKRYQCFCKEYSGNHLYKIACGPNGEDYHWTKELMSRINKWHAKGISLHYYTLPTGEWEKKGSATQFDEKEYYQTIEKTLKIEEIIEKHLAIMDTCDPDHDISLIVDEWGTWYDVEPGTNPGFLYQQNTMRDAIVAAINLNIFNKHSDRISMANIAQVVNVLQSMILTEGEKMIKTPTYEVFSQYKGHQGAVLVDSCIDVKTTGMDEVQIPMLSESVSVAEDARGKKITITLSNASLTEDVSVAIAPQGGYVFQGDVNVSLLTAEVHAHNTWDEPETVKALEKEEVWDTTLSQAEVLLPACSVCRISAYVSES